MIQARLKRKKLSCIFTPIFTNSVEVVVKQLNIHACFSPAVNLHVMHCAVTAGGHFVTMAGLGGKHLEGYIRRFS